MGVFGDLRGTPCSFLPEFRMGLLGIKAKNWKQRHERASHERLSQSNSTMSDYS